MFCSDDRWVMHHQGGGLVHKVKFPDQSFLNRGIAKEEDDKMLGQLLKQSMETAEATIEDPKSSGSVEPKVMPT